MQMTEVFFQLYLFLFWVHMHAWVVWGHAYILEYTRGSLQIICLKLILSFYRMGPEV